MQQRAEAELIDTAQIMRASRTSNGAGGFTSAWAAVEVNDETDIPCLLAPFKQGNRGESIQGDQVTATGDWVFTFPAETPILPTDRIEHSSATYEVTEVRERRSLEFVTRAIAKKVQ